ncbi:hypothetical protein CONLIGDRAFT_186868 [Coniochaeta ligniaria NRRL 30616]|uniref:Uncharacterized protein n=1 Tax=Coniochaeta ligniaria NRRL 30616 TaxID=1408157 RepID=A0A1J7J0R7_9PEZI|nr:hypothetical protein CONLIGDRAFT_186868 [Coniochaeta ligniaria NRRL 30616]
MKESVCERRRLSHTIQLLSPFTSFRKGPVRFDDNLKKGIEPRNNEVVLDDALKARVVEGSPCHMYKYSQRPPLCSCFPSPSLIHPHQHTLSIQILSYLLFTPTHQQPSIHHPLSKPPTHHPSPRDRQRLVYFLQVTPFLLAMTNTDMSFHLASLPKELQDMVWVSTTEVDRIPTMQCIEVDFLDGLQDAGEWFELPHAPAAYLPTRRFGGAGTGDTSFFFGMRRLSQTSPEARDAVQHFQRVVRRKNPDDFVEVEVKHRNREGSSAGAEDMSIWLNTKRDVICLQSPSQLLSRALPSGTLETWFSEGEGASGAVKVSWFSDLVGYHQSSLDFYRPLPFFGLDQMEHVAIDFQCEKARHSIHPNCSATGCRLFRKAYHIELYHTAGEERKYCVTCLETYLDKINKAVQDKEVDQYYLEPRMDDEFSIFEDRDWAELLGPDEPGTFTCQSCSGQFACGNGRLAKVAEGGWPFDVTQYIGRQPTCYTWHLPGKGTDIETLLMGRLPSLKKFYVIDTSIKLRPGRQLTLPHEQFAGNACKFVEVDTHDDAWDIHPNMWPPYNEGTNPAPLNSFAFADELQRVAWDFMCRKQAKELMDLENNGNANDDDDPLKSSVQDKQPLDRPILVDPGLETRLRALQGPAMVPNTSLQPSWPDNLLPVKVKVMARIDDGLRESETSEADDDVVFN